MCQKQEPSDDYYGLFPTAHMIGYDCSEFKNFMSRQKNGFELKRLILSDAVMTEAQLKKLT